MRFSSLTTLILLAHVCLSQTSYDPLKSSVSSEAMTEDLKLLQTVLRENHPGLFSFNTSEQIEALFSRAVPEGEGAPPLKAFGTFAGIIDEIKDGHTNASIGEFLTDYILHSKKFFPFTLRVLNEGVYVNHNFSEHEYLQRGSKIVSINSVPIEEILTNLKQFVTCDGYSRLSKMEQLEGQFWWYYGLKYGYRQTFMIEFNNPGSSETKRLVASALGHSDRFDILSEVYGFEWEPEEKIAFSIQGDIAVITVNQFHGVSKMIYKSFLENCFETIDRNDIEHVVIDIRKNGGGKEGYENILLSFLNHHMTEKYKSIKAINLKSDVYDHMTKGGRKRLADWVYRNFEFEDTDEGWTRKRERFKSTFSKSKTAYRGDVYVLISGQVFSSGADFAAMAKAYVPNCTLIGTETRGGQYLNTSGYYYRLVLPNTGFVVEIPRVRFELNVPIGDKGRGVVPDVEVHQTLTDFISCKDSHMQKVFEIVHERTAILSQKSD